MNAGASAPPPLDVVIAPDALAQLGRRAIEKRWRRALVVMDRNTEAVAGRAVVTQLRGAGVDARALIFDQRSDLHADRDELARVQGELAPDAVPVSVGAGVITDIVRYAAHACRRDFICVATAASMDGYASSVAALQFTGVKVTLPARAPRAIYADPRVIAAAPRELTRAGLGDLLAKATAGVDWLAAHLLYGERYCAAVAARVSAALALAVRRAPAVVAGDAAAVTELLSGLIESGVAMAIFGNSRPASGCEHHASHFWDLLAARGRRGHTSHGLQAGYATRFAMRLQQFAFAGGVADLVDPAAPADPLGTPAREWLGEPTTEIAAAVAEKRHYIESSAGAWPADRATWGRARAALAPSLALFADVGRALEIAGIPSGPGFLGLEKPTLRATFTYAGRLRARYTTIDFLEGQGVLGQALDAILD